MSSTNMRCDPKELYHLFRQNIFSLLLKRARNKTVAEDLTSEAFTRICECNAKGTECENPKSYLYRVALNLLNDHHTTTQKSTLIDAVVLENNPTDQQTTDLNKEVARCMLPLIAQLPHKYKEAVFLADIQQISQSAVAKQLNISLPGAKSRIQRGRKQLKDLLLNSCHIEADQFGNIVSCVC